MPERNMSQQNLLARFKQRLVGLFVSLVAVGMFFYNWYSALTRGEYWEKASFIFPFFAFLGLAMFLFPITKEECLARHGSEQLTWSTLRVTQKFLIITGAIAGLLNYTFMSRL